jgi:prepilin-type N-terminal cleavage/methylation domain-containing protein
MVSDVKRNKKNAAFTLIELVIAVGVLALASGALFGAFAISLQMSFRATRFQAMSIEAQLQMEQLVGRPWTTDLGLPHVCSPSGACTSTSAQCTGPGIPWGIRQINASSCRTLDVLVTYEVRRTSYRSFDTAPVSLGNSLPAPPPIANGSLANILLTQPSPFLPPGSDAERLDVIMITIHVMEPGMLIDSAFTHRNIVNVSGNVI